MAIKIFQDVFLAFQKDEEVKKTTKSRFDFWQPVTGHVGSAMPWFNDRNSHVTLHGTRTQTWVNFEQHFTTKFLPFLDEFQVGFNYNELSKLRILNGPTPRTEWQTRHGPNSGQVAGLVSWLMIGYRKWLGFHDWPHLNCLSLVNAAGRVIGSFRLKNDPFVKNGLFAFLFVLVFLKKSKDMDGMSFFWHFFYLG